MGCLFTAPKNAQDCGHSPFLQIGPTSFKCTVSVRHGRNMGSFWGQLQPTRPQLPNLGPLGSNFGPTWLQDGATWPPNLDPFGSNLAPSWGPHGFKIGTWPAQYEIVKTRRVCTSISHDFLASMMLRAEHCSQCCVSVGPNLVWSCRQSVPSCSMLDLTWTSICVAWLQVSLWAQLQPDMTNWRQLGSKTRANFADSMTRWFLLPTFLGFSWGSCNASWTQLRRQHRTKLRMLSPTCIQTCPSCVDQLDSSLGPSWSQLARVRRKLDPSWAQAQGQGWSSLTPVGFGWAK